MIIIPVERMLAILSQIRESCERYIHQTVQDQIIVVLQARNGIVSTSIHHSIPTLYIPTIA